MALFAGNIDDLNSLYINQLRHLLSTEEQIVDALPKMIDNATDQQIKDALQSHLQESELHAERVEDILSALTGDIDEKKCPATAAIIAAGEAHVKAANDPYVRDAAIIAAAQKIEHFEMAAYGTVRNWAQVLGHTDQAVILNKTLQEEGHADHLLSTIAERTNPQASVAA